MRLLAARPVVRRPEELRVIIIFIISGDCRVCERKSQGLEGGQPGLVGFPVLHVVPGVLATREYERRSGRSSPTLRHVGICCLT